MLVSDVEGNYRRVALPACRRHRPTPTRRERTAFALALTSLSRRQLPIMLERNSAIGFPVGPALHAAKRELRDHILALRNALPPEVRAKATAAIAARLISLPSFAAARTVLLTLAFRSE